MKEIEWSDEALDDMAKLEKAPAIRIKAAVDRFLQTGAGDIKRLQGFQPPEFRLRVGDFRIRFDQNQNLIRVLRVLDRKNAYR